MSCYPRLTVDLDVIGEHTRRLVKHLLPAGFALVGVTKAVDGEPSVGQEMLEAGCAGLADSRLPSLARLAAHCLAPLTLIRTPQRDEFEAAAGVVDRVLLADVDAAKALGRYASGAPIEVLLTVDLGDRREGVLPSVAPEIAARLWRLPGIQLAGISVNFGCFSGQLPSVALFRQAENVLASIADKCAVEPMLSLGGTCALQHLDGFRPLYATEIRCGGGPIYGYDFVTMAPLDGMTRTDPVLTAAVLECYWKPPASNSRGGFDAFGHVPEVDLPTDAAYFSLLDLGRRDCEPRGLRPLIQNAYLAGATSDVSVLITQAPLRPGDTVPFAADYDALVRAQTSPFVTRQFIHRSQHPEPDETDSTPGDR